MFEMSPTVAMLFEALSKAQGAIQNPVKESDNPFFKSKYVELDDVLNIIREPFAANGLFVSQFPVGTNDKGELVLMTIIGHKSGEWMKSEFSIALTKKDTQGYGSAITYARRYVLQAIARLTGTDDDGEAAVGRGNGNAEKSASQSTQGKQSQSKSTQATTTSAKEDGWVDGVFKDSRHDGTYPWVSIETSKGTNEFSFPNGQPPGALKTHTQWNQLLNTPCRIKALQSMRSGVKYLLLKDIEFPSNETAEKLPMDDM